MKNLKGLGAGVAILAILACSALTISVASPTEMPEELEDDDGFVNLYNLDIPHDNDTVVENEVKEIIAEDWADTWDPPQEMKDWFPYYISGKDEDGAVVFIKEFGKWHFSDLVNHKGKNASNELFDKYYEQYLHRFLKEGKEHGAIIIFDWDGFSMSNFDSKEALKLTLRQLTTLEKTSRVLKHTFLINTNFAAQTMMNIARPLMGTVLENAEIYGTRKEKWLPHLLAKLPREVLPARYLETTTKH